jgi:iron complex outermembrane recepter protein
MASGGANAAERRCCFLCITAGLLRRSAAIAAAAISTLFILVGASHAQTITELKKLSIEQLGNIEVTSAAKQPEPLSDAPAAIYVITHDDIIRSGAMTLPEMLRLAPNLEVAQLNATSYAISARGFNVGSNASLSDKLLVLIDGRNVYSPLFAGVYWDMQAVPPEDIERIEVISGPAGTLYGANAVDGVINIITRDSKETQGGLLDVFAGNLERGGMLQYGGKIGDNLTYRVYGMGAEFSPFVTAAGQQANDGWGRPQGGFRTDWNNSTDHVTLEGDDFYSREDPSSNITGRDAIASWQHQFSDGSNLQTEAYYDVAKRYTDGNGGFTVDTYDLSAQYNFAVGSWNSIAVGADERVISYNIANTPTLLFNPASATLNLASLFGQDIMAVAPRLKLTLGLKLENDPYVGMEPLPEVRLAWKPEDNVLLWSAVSRAIRAPTPVDENIIERSGTTNILQGSPNFVPETLIAYEVGTRIQPAPRTSFSVSTFYDQYQDLRSLEPTPGGPIFPGLGGLPLHWANLMAGHVYGLEAWGDYRVTDWWRLSAGFNIQHEALFFEPGSSGLGGLALAADDPNHQAQLRSYVDFGHGVNWSTFLRYVGKLHDPGVPDYGELDTRLSWQITPQLELALSGFNLIHSKHPEFIEPGITDEVPRSFLVETRWRF